MVRHSIALLIAWRLAENEAVRLRQTEIFPAHFFLGILKVVELDLREILAVNTTLSESDICTEVEMNEALRLALHRQGLDTTRIRRRVRRSLPQGDTVVQAGRQIRRSLEARELFRIAEQLAFDQNGGVVSPQHLYASFSQVRCPILLHALQAEGLEFDTIFCNVVNIPIEQKSITITHEMIPKSAEVKKRPERQMVHSGLAEKLGRDITQLAKNGALPPIIGRKLETKALLQTLLRSRKNNAILIGEAGVGKTCIVEGLAQMIASGIAPSAFAEMRIVEIPMAALVAGTSHRGEMEEKLHGLIAQAKSDPSLIFFIDEIHLIVGAGAGSTSAIDVSNLLKPALARGEIRVIGATTTQEFRKYIEPDTALARRFEVIHIEEPSRDEALTILEGLKEHIERHHGLRVEQSALEAAVDLTIRYLPAHRLPDKAIDVLDQACAQSRMRSLSGDFRAGLKGALYIERSDVAAAVALRCRVPVGNLTMDESARLLMLETELEMRVKGQRRAIEAVSETIRLARSGLRQGGRPVGAFLFAGPSGTGKTELAKALAYCLFGSEQKLIRIDMSEFMEAHSVSKLLGAPPGFIGHDQGGQLTERVRSQPHSVILLDEVEKAHPKILDIFLQIFDDGFVTDSHGVHCDFRESIVIMTSNIGASSGKTSIGFQQGDEEASPYDRLERSVLAETRKLFRPEFINRLTDIIPFEPLGPEEVKQVLTLMVDRLNERLKSKKITLELTPESQALLIAQGSSKEYGVRYLERIIERVIMRPLSEIILAGQIEPNVCCEAQVTDGQIKIAIVKAMKNGQA
jgi:ATP-dependent Clp protease ATP-binding subunit ClpC